MNIALIAHDAKKKLMQNFCIAYRGILTKNDLFATGTTGRLIEEVTNLNVHKYLAGHLGGEQQMGADIEHNHIDLVIFLRDPLTSKSHEPDEQCGQAVRYAQYSACHKSCIRGTFDQSTGQRRFRVA